MSRATRKSTTRSAGKSITELYSQFEKAHVAAQAVPSPKPPSVSSAEFDRALCKSSAIAARIVKTPADNIDEMLLKIRVACWCVNAPNDLAKLDHWMPGGVSNGEELDALVSLREDLRKSTTRGKDAAWLALSEQFEAGREAVRAADKKGTDRDVEAARRRMSALTVRIAKLPASTIDGLKLKAAAVAYCHAGEAKIKLANNQTTDVRLAQSIIHDLLAL